MKKERKLLFLLMLSLFFVILPGQVLAEERSIFVGDLIEIRISGQAFSREELADKFKAFEVVDIKEDAGGYLITLRSFETGEKKVRLGNKEIVIDIKSTLDEIERDDIFEGALNPEEMGFYVEWQYVFYVLLAISLLSGGIYFRSYHKKRKVSLLSPYQRFNNQMEGVSMEDNQYFVRLTSCFKEYLEALYSCRIRGKTSSEIMGEISGISGLQAELQDTRSWLEESDRLKFSGITVSRGKKQDVYEGLAELVRKIEMGRIGGQKIEIGEQKNEEVGS